MNEMSVRILRLEPMEVATFHAFGPAPEAEAWRKLQTWSQPRRRLGEESFHRIFGFNNPNPSVGSPNYGYEFWIEAGHEDGVTDPSVEFKRFGGGLYAVTECISVEQIGTTWQRLVAWCEDSPYQIAHHQWLEEHLERGEIVPEQLSLLLYLPIAE